MGLDVKRVENHCTTVLNHCTKPLYYSKQPFIEKASSLVPHLSAIGFGQTAHRVYPFMTTFAAYFSPSLSPLFPVSLLHLILDRKAKNKKGKLDLDQLKGFQ